MIEEQSTKKNEEIIHFLGLNFSTLSNKQIIDFFSSCQTGENFRYIVTPNVQHVVMADKNPSQKPVYNSAIFSVCDSQPVRMLARLKGHSLPLVTGSDLTVSLFDKVIQPGNKISVVCANQQLKEALIAKYADINWSIIVPPAQTVPGTQAFEECVSFIANSDARFTFVSLGTPKSELMCHSAAKRPNCKGTALCNGAALEFMAEVKKRAPKSIRGSGFEWLYRLIKEPRRLSQRYMSSIFPLMLIMLREFKPRS